MMSVDSTITDGSLVLALPLAVAAGLVSFLSPVRAAAGARLPVVRHRPLGG